MIWQNCLYAEDCASVLVNKSLPVPVTWLNCLDVEECASDLAELPGCGGVC